MRFGRWAVVALPLVCVGLGVAVSCGNSGPSPGDLAHGCSINSDCNAPLVCVFGLCHEQCAESRDCPMGERCVTAGTDKVCELPNESTCAGTSACPMGLTCSSLDMQCRNGCDPKAANPGCQVAGDICGPDMTCYSPMEAAEAGIEAGGGDATTDGAGGDAAGDAPGDAPGDSPGDTTTGDSPSDAPQDADGGVACTPLDGGDPDAGPLLFHPSNFDPNNPVGPDGGAIALDAGADAGGIDWTNAPDVVISANCNSGPSCFQVQPVTIKLAPGFVADLYVMNSLLLNTGVTATLPAVYTAQSNPVILAVRTTVRIQGTLNVSSYQYQPGPGAAPFNAVLGHGGGGSGHGAQYPNSAAGGASFCGQGGAGAFSSGNQAPGGQTYGIPSIVPLQSGSAGGEDPLSQYYGGGGGGGIQISAGQSIDVSGVGLINANGGYYYGGGGSGGAILLEAPVVTIEGILVANGGGGGSVYTSNLGNPGDTSAKPAPGWLDGGTGGAGAQNGGTEGVADDAGHLGSGGGGVGWIRINTACGAVISDAGTTIISPFMDGGCASMGTIQY